MGMLACLEMTKHKNSITELLQECLAPFNDKEQSDTPPYVIYQHFDNFCKQRSLSLPDVEDNLRRLLEPYIDSYVLTF